MAFLAQRISVTSSGVEIPVPPAHDLAPGACLELRNTSAVNGVRIGGPGVEFLNGGGVLISPGNTWHPQLELREGDTITAITDDLNTATLDVLWYRV